jgi:hypothetical protein
MIDKIFDNPFWPFLMVGFLFVVMTCSSIYERAAIQVDGTVVGREVVCQQPANNRCVTNYTLRRTADGSLYNYSAGPTNESLSSDLRVGAFVEKWRWHLIYKVDGNEVDDFPVLLFVGMLLMGFFAIGLWGVKMIYKSY